MTIEERKIQLGVAVDATEAKSGFAEVKQSAKEMASAITTDGARAARTIESLGSEGAGSAQKFDASTRSIISSIQRTTAASEAGERGTRKFFESLAQQRGVDTGALKPYLDQLDAVQAKQGSVGVSAAQTAAAMRQLPAQISDVVVSLQGGQAPLTVLLQQGSQIKDSFGGVGNALKSVGTFALGVINPLTVAAAAAAALGTAYYQSSKEIDAYRVAITMSGNAAGVTMGQLQLAARNIGRSGGSEGSAAAALAQFAAAGDVAGESLERVASVALKLEKTTGQSIAETVKQFSELGKEPVNASVKLNETFRYLTAATYDQIKALEDQGRTEEAAALAQKTYTDEMAKRTAALSANLGIIERSWNAVTSAAAAGWRAILNVGAEASPELQLDKVRRDVEYMEKQQALRRSQGKDSGDIDPGLEAKRRLLATLEGTVKLNQADAKAQGEAAAAGAARADWAKLENSLITKRSQLGKIEEEIRAKGLADGRSEFEIQKLINAAREKYKDRSGIAAAARIDKAELNLDIQKYRDALAEMTNSTGRAEKVMEAQRAAGLLSEKDYYDAKRSFVQQNADARAAELDQENARLKAENASGARRLELDKQIQANGAKRKEILADAAASITILTVQETAAVQARTAAYEAARQAAEGLLQTQNRAQDRDISSLGMGDRSRQYNAGRNQIDDRYDQQRLALENNRRLLEIQKDSAGNSKFTAEAKQRYDAELALIEEFQGKAIQSFDGYWQRRMDGETNASLGASRAVANYLDNARDVARQTETLYTNTFSSMEDALVQFATTGKINFKSLATSIIADMVRIQARATLSNVLSNLFGGGLSAAGVQASGAVTSPVVGAGRIQTTNLPAIASAKGNVFDAPGLSAYSSTIVSRPTVFPFAKGVGLMGEAGPEAIMPLRRGSDGRLGVAAGGGGGQNVTVNVYGGNGQDAQVTQKQTDDGLQIDVMLDQFEGRMAEKFAYRSGPLYQVVNSGFMPRS